MILTFGSSRRAESQSVDTSGSSVEGDMAQISLLSFGGVPKARTRNLKRHKSIEIPGSRWRAPRNDETSTLRLLRLELLHRAAGVAPGGKTAAHMRDRLQPHILRGLGRQRRAHAAGAVKHEFLVLLENRFGIGAGRIDPEFQHAAGAGERAGNPPLALDLAGVADIDDHDVVAFRRLDGLHGAQGFDLGIGFVDQGLDAAMDALGHSIIPLSSVIPGRCEASNPETRSFIFITSRFRVRAARAPE